MKENIVRKPAYQERFNHSKIDAKSPIRNLASEEVIGLHRIRQARAQHWDVSINDSLKTSTAKHKLPTDTLSLVTTGWPQHVLSFNMLSIIFTAPTRTARFLTTFTGGTSSSA